MDDGLAPVDDQYDMNWSSTTLGNSDNDLSMGEEAMDLLKPMRSQFSRSKHLWYLRALPTSIGVYIVALIAAFPWPSWVAGVLAIGAVLAQVAAFGFRQIAVSCYNEAESIRRRVMLQDGLGIIPSPVQLARFQERSADLKSEEAVLNRTYYDSSEPQGARRLLDIISQAAFFTGSLARRTWKMLAVVAILGFVAPVALVLVVALVHTSESAADIVARVVVASMAFWAAGDVTAMVVQFFQVALNADRILDQCESLLRKTTPQMIDALLMYAEYNCAIGKSPPIPYWIYGAYRDKLNLAWNERKIALEVEGV